MNRKNKKSKAFDFLIGEMVSKSIKWNTKKEKNRQIFLFYLAVVLSTQFLNHILFNDKMVIQVRHIYNTHSSMSQTLDILSVYSVYASAVFQCMNKSNNNKTRMFNGFSLTVYSYALLLMFVSAVIYVYYRMLTVFKI